MKHGRREAEGCEEKAERNARDGQARHRGQETEGGIGADPGEQAERESGQRGEEEDGAGRPHRLSARSRSLRSAPPKPSPAPEVASRGAAGIVARREGRYWLVGR